MHFCIWIYSVLFSCFSYPWCGACWRSVVNRRTAKDSCCPGLVCGYFLHLCVPQAKENPDQMARFLEDREQSSLNQSSQLETECRVQKADPVSGKAPRRQLYHAAGWGPNHRRWAFLLQDRTARIQKLLLLGKYRDHRCLTWALKVMLWLFQDLYMIGIVQIF